MTLRHRPCFQGLFADDISSESFWIRETGRLELPALQEASEITLEGEVLPPDAADSTAHGKLGLALRLNQRPAGQYDDLPIGPFCLRCPLPASPGPEHCVPFEIELQGVAVSNVLAWLGRVSGLGLLQPWRAQARNRRVRIRRVALDGETVFDFSIRLAPYSAAFARHKSRLGLNIVGFLTADLGLGESARCMVRAADAAALPATLVPLKLNCVNRLGDQTYSARLEDSNPHRVNVVHIDPPAARDIDHHHGPDFRRGKYNIGYFAWELPEFPDSWVPAFDYFDEIWCPSDFTRAAVAMKSPLPVLTLPHAIAFPRPTTDTKTLRQKFGLPVDPFLFLFLYDLNSYSARKNPAGAIAAFRASGLAGSGAALVIKVQNAAQNPADFAGLRSAVQDLPGTILISSTLAREEIYELESACDCFVSLHRSEGFGIAPAECMYLGKPVIATDWSGTAEFLSAQTGCPVRYTLSTIGQTHGPYVKGQTWAEPDSLHAADWMRRLFSDRALASTLGAAGRHLIETRFSPAAIGARYRQRLESIATW